MQGGGKLPGKNPVDQALSVEAGFADKSRRDNFNTEMRLALGPTAGMAGMGGRFINNFQP